MTLQVSLLQAKCSYIEYKHRTFGADIELAWCSEKMWFIASGLEWVEK